MFVRDYEWYVRHLMEHLGRQPNDVLIVDDVGTWCREHGIAEKDERKPCKLVVGSDDGVRMIINELIPDDVVSERINALRIRSQLTNNVADRADRLNSATRKLAYLFLREYAANSPELINDDLAAEQWVFDQMDRFGTLQP